MLVSEDGGMRSRNRKMLVYQAQLGDWDNLNHLLVCKNTKKAAIVDPFFADYWINFCRDNEWELEQVWLTHSHWDHSKGVEGLQDKQVWVHQDESNAVGMALESNMVKPSLYFCEPQLEN